MSFFILVTCLSLFCWAKFSFNVWIFAQSCIHLKSIFIDYVLVPCAAHYSRCIFCDLEFTVSGKRTTQVPSTVLWKSFMGGEKKKELFSLWEWIREDAKEVTLTGGRILQKSVYGNLSRGPKVRNCVIIYGRGYSSFCLSTRNRETKTKRGRWELRGLDVL